MRPQRRRVNQADPFDLWEIEIDLNFLLVALVRLDRTVARAADEASQVRAPLLNAVEVFRVQVPGLRTMRDVAEHADEYNLAKGRRSSSIRRSQVQNWSMSWNGNGGLVWHWLGHELDVDSASSAATTLYNAFDATLVPILGDSHRSAETDDRVSE